MLNGSGGKLEIAHESVEAIEKLKLEPRLKAPEDKIRGALAHSRYIIEIRLINELYSGAYFHTAKHKQLLEVNKCRLQFPHPSSPHSPIEPPEKPLKPFLTDYAGLDPCAVWLRARASSSFSFPIGELFRSEMFPKLVIASNTSRDRVTSTIQHYLQRQPVFEFRFTAKTGRSDPILERYCTTRVVVVHICDYAIFHEVFDASTPHTKYLLILLVDTSLPSCWNTILSTLKAIQSLHTRGKSVEILDVRAVTSDGEPVPKRTPTTFKLSTPPDGSGVWSSRVNTTHRP